MEHILQAVENYIIAKNSSKTWVAGRAYYSSADSALAQSLLQNKLPILVRR